MVFMSLLPVGLIQFSLCWKMATGMAAYLLFGLGGMLLGLFLFDLLRKILSKQAVTYVTGVKASV